MKRPLLLVAVFTSLFLGNLPAQNARLVQFDLIDFSTGIVSLRNFDTVAQDISSWRFCSHDADQVRIYTGAGLAGVTLAAGQSLRISFNNAFADADPLTRNISEFPGSFAGPLSPNNAFGLQAYADLDGSGAISFGTPADVVDHLQWSPGGVPNMTADERSDEAAAAGLWGNLNDWIATSPDTTRLVFNGDPNNLSSGSASFLVVPEPSTFTLLGGAALSALWCWRRRAR